MLADATPQEYVAYFIGINSRRIVTELRIIKWILFGAACGSAAHRQLICFLMTGGSIGVRSAVGPAI